SSRHCPRGWEGEVTASIREPGDSSRRPLPGRAPRERNAVTEHAGSHSGARVLLLSTADTDLLAAKASGADYRVANPSRTDPEELPDLLAGIDVAVVRLLGGRRAWEEGLDAVLASGIPVIALGGEAAPDAELMSLSTVPAGVSTQALAYLVEGGPENLRELARFLSDAVLLTGEGFQPPKKMPEFGVHGDRSREAGRPTVGLVFYRAHALSGHKTGR